MKVFAAFTSVPENEITCLKYVRIAERKEKKNKGIYWIQSGQYFRIIADNFHEAYEMLKAEITSEKYFISHLVQSSNKE